MSADREDPRARYRRRMEEARVDQRELEVELARLSRGRVASFLLAAAAFLLIETSPRAWWPWLLGVGTIAVVGFGALVVRHRRRRRALERARLRERIAQEGEARLDRTWEGIPLAPLGVVPEGHPFALDLDVLGAGSLGHLLGRVSTDPGRAALRRALLDPFAPQPASALELLAPRADGPVGGPDPGWTARIEERRRAIEKLAEDPDLLETLEIVGREVRGDPDPEATRAFLRWAGGEDWLPEHRWTVPLARALAIATPAGTAAWLLGWGPGALPLIGGLAALALTRWVAPHAVRRYTAAEGGEGDPLRWAALLGAAREAEVGGPLGAGMRETDAEDALLRLRRVSDLAALRRSSLAHFPMAALFAWDVHVLNRLERWRRRHGREADRWVRAVGELELTASLAGLRHDHPEWCAAQIEDEGSLFGAALRHPLLAPADAVPNPVELPDPGRLLLVTGSNMSGKSTLLRALGTNQLLAMMGAPVAADSFRTRPLLPWTSMRVTDSLTRGVSYFLAELHRLKAVVEAARQGPVLYLLDEILQGTNTAERRIAARVVLAHLLRTGAIGAVTTHDLTLTDATALRERSDNVHFREEVVDSEGERRLRFDHLLREGPATSRNALLLLEMVGLGAEEAEGEGAGGEPR